MEIKHEESKSTNDVSPKLTFAVWQFFGQYVEQAKDNENGMPIELLTNIISTNHPDLNDDCLFQIFSAKTLDLMDLCSVAETCTRFKQIAGRVIPKELSIEFGAGTITVYLGSYKLRTLEKNDVGRVFKNFGSAMTKVSISSVDCFAEYFLLMVARHCCDGNLYSLSIRNFTISEDVAVKLKPIFGRMHQLHFDNVSVVGDKTVFEKCDSLLDLQVWNDRNCDVVLENYFPKLERFSFIKFNGHFSSRTVNKSTFHILKTFIAQCTAIRTLQLSFYSGHDDSHTMQLIGDNCKELEELSITMGGMTIAALQPMQQLKSLRVLELFYASFDDFKIFSWMTQLRELHLIYCRLPTDVTQFDYLAQITKLELRSFNTLYVVDMISRLRNLEELTIRSSYYTADFELDEKIFTKIVDIVKGRQKVLTLNNFNVKNSDDQNQAKLFPLRSLT